MPAVTTGGDELEVRTADGWILSVLHLHAVGEPQGVAVLGHAMMVDRRSMDRPAGAGLASTLAARGWHVLLADVRGHGASGPTPEAGGAWTYDDVVFQDLPALIGEARALHPGLPAALVGHSLVGHMSMAAAGSGAYGAAAGPDLHVLIATNTWIWGLDPRRDLLRARDTLLFLGITRLFGRFPSRLVRMGPASEARGYVGDLGRFLFSGVWGSADGRHDYLRNLGRVTGPILALSGAADGLMAHPAAVARWSAHLTSADVALRVLRSGDLGLSEDPGHMEIVTDPGSRGVWEEIARWMTAHRRGCRGGYVR